MNSAARLARQERALKRGLRRLVGLASLRGTRRRVLVELPRGAKGRCLFRVCPFVVSVDGYEEEL